MKTGTVIKDVALAALVGFFVYIYYTKKVAVEPVKAEQVQAVQTTPTPAAEPVGFKGKRLDEYYAMLKGPNVEQAILITVDKSGALKMTYDCNHNTAAVAHVYLQEVALKLLKGK